LDLQSLGYQKSIHFVPTIPPWNIAGSSHIHIIPTIPGVHKSDPTELQQAITEQALSWK
jgi:hypothetical protein